MKQHRELQQNKRFGLFYKMVSYAVGGVAVILFIIAEDSFSSTKPILGIISFALLIVAFMMYDRGKRHLVSSAGEVLSHDNRPPIIYLRSFDADETADQDEKILADIMQEVGPFIAIGRPGDKLPPLGASRFYVEDKNWRNKVTQLLDISVLVVLRAGKTGGLIWELRKCRKRLTPNSLAVLIPRNRSEYEVFCQMVEDAELRMVLPKFPVKKLARFKASELAGVMHFSDEWEGSITVFKKAALKGNNYEFASSTSRAEERLRLAFQQVAKRSGLLIRKPETNFFAIIGYSYMALVFVVIAVLGILILFGYLK